MNNTIRLFLIPMLLIFAVSVNGQEQGDPQHQGPPPMFEDVDANGDGEITVEEAQAFFGHEPDFDQQFDDTDTNDDGVVDHAEFEAAGDNYGGPGTGGDYDDPGTGGDDYEGDGDKGPMFEDVDANGDGEITVEEAQAFFGHEPDFDQRFDDTDTNDDGVVDHAEFEAAGPNYGGPGTGEYYDDHGTGGDYDGATDTGEYYDDPATGGGDYGGYGDHTMNNCMAIDQGMDTYWVDGDEFAVYDDPGCSDILGNTGGGYYEGDGYYCAICDMYFQTAEEMDQHAADMGHTMEGGCDPNVDYPNNPPGPDGGCANYEDCNGNGAFDIGEPCHDGGEGDDHGNDGGY